MDARASQRARLRDTVGLRVLHDLIIVVRLANGYEARNLCEARKQAVSGHPAPTGWIAGGVALSGRKTCPKSIVLGDNIVIDR